MPRELLLVAPRTVTLAEYEPPRLMPTSALLRTVFSAVSHGTEMLLYRGEAPKFLHGWDDRLRHFVPRTPTTPQAPLPLGYESVARVVEVGAEARGLAVGDLVWIDAPHREVHIIDTTRPPPLWRFPEQCDPRSLAFFALTRVALGAVHDAEPVLGGSAVVSGLGVVGQLCGQLLRRAGVRHVFGIDRDPERLALAERFGIIPVLAEPEDPAAAIKRQMPGVDVAIEASGRYAGLASALRCLSPMGRVVVVSSYGNQASGLSLGHEFHRNRITLVSSMTVNGCPHPKAPLWSLERLNQAAADFISDGSLEVLPLITSIVPFQTAPEAYKVIDGQTTPPLKVLFAYG